MKNPDAEKEVSVLRLDIPVHPQEKGDYIRRSRARKMKLADWVRWKLNTPDED